MARIRSELRAVFRADNRQFLRTVKGTKRVIGSLVRTTAAIGVGAAALGTLGVKKFFAWEKALSEINTIARMSKVEMDKFAKSMMRISESWGIDKIQIAGGAYQVFSKQLAKTADDAEIFLDVAAQLSKAGVSDMATTTQLLAGILNDFGKSARDATDVADLLFRTVEIGGANMTDWAESLKRVAPMVSGMNISMEEMLSILAVSTQGTKDAQDAVTGLGAAITSLTKPTVKMEKTLKRFYGTSDISEIKKQENLIDIFDRLAASTNGSAKELAELFGEKRAFNQILAITGKRVAEVRHGMDQLTDRQGAMKRATGEFTDDAGDKWAKAMVRIDNILTEVGDQIATKMIPLLDSFNAWFSDEKNKEAVNGFFKGLATGIETTVLMLANLIKKYKEARDYWVKQGELLGDFLTPKISETQANIEAALRANAKKRGMEITPGNIETLRKEYRSRLGESPTDSQMLKYLESMNRKLDRLPQAQEAQ